MLQLIASQLFFWFGRLIWLFVAFYVLRVALFVVEQVAQRSSFIPPAPFMGEPLFRISPALLVPRWESLVIELLVFFLALFWGIWCCAAFIFPAATRQERDAGIDTLKDNLFDRAIPIVLLGQAGSVALVPPDAKAGGPALVFVDAWTALVVSKEGRFTRGIGAGFGKLEDGETVYTSVDLRVQKVRRVITARTRNGIDVSVELVLEIEVERPPEWKQDDGRFDFLEPALYKIAYRERAELLDRATNSALRPPAWCWFEAVEQLAVQNLVEQIARYTLDQLLAADNPNQNCFTTLAKDVKAALAKDAREYGAYVREAEIVDLRLSAAVQLQRIESWQTVWQYREAISEARMAAEQRQMEDSARATAMREMINTLSRTVTETPDADSPQLVFMRLLQAMERMASEPRTHERIPTEELEALRDFMRPGRADGK